MTSAVVPLPVAKAPPVPLTGTKRPRNPRTKPEHKPVMRADLLPSNLTASKARAIGALFDAWSRCAVALGHEQWRLFFETGRFNRQHDTDKATIATRRARGLGGLGQSKAAILAGCVRAFRERKVRGLRGPRRSRHTGVSDDPRVTNPYFSEKGKQGEGAQGSQIDASQ